MTRLLLAAGLGATLLVCACSFNTSGYSAPDLSAGEDAPLDLARRDSAVDHGTDRSQHDGARDLLRDRAVDLPLAVDHPRTPDLKPELKPGIDLLPADLKPPPDLLGPDLWPPDLPPCAGLVCPLGCNASLGRCNRLAPANGAATVTTAFAQVTAGLTVNALAQLSTNTGAITVGGVTVRQAKNGLSEGIWWEVLPQGTGNPELSIFVMSSLQIQATRELRLSGQRAAVIYVTGDATIAGRLVVWPGSPNGIAGGFAGGDSDNDANACHGGEGIAGSSSGNEDSGGGGGGRQGGGGQGGDGGSVGGGAAGTNNGNATLVPLYGGCGGGGGGSSNGLGGSGGGGGGAIHLAVNGALSLLAGGQISAPGGFGSASTGYVGGGGGGSGGAILLEAAKLNLGGSVAANGGGGGAGGSLGADGNYGSFGVLGGLGGAADVNEASYSGSGGNGGGLSAGKGQNGGDVTHNGGGGGGGTGRIRFNGSVASLPGLTVSPTASTSTSVAIW